MKTTKYILLIFIFSFYDSSYTMENHKATPFVGDLIVIISAYLDLSSITNLLAICSPVYNLYGKGISNTILYQYAKMTQEKWALIQFGINKFLQQNNFITNILNDNDYLNCLTHYAQVDNTTMLRHLITHENEVNKNRRIQVLTFFKYIKARHNKLDTNQILSNLDYNMRAYKGLAKKENCLNNDYFFSAVKANNSDCLKIFINNYFPIDIQDSQGNTALHIATNNNHEKIAQLLIKNKASFIIQNNIGNTIVHVAAFAGNKKLIQACLAHGLSLLIPNKYGNTPLHLAAWTGQKNAMVLLLNNGSDINASNKHLNTPLHLAAWAGQTIVVQILLAKRAHIDIKNKYKCTALHLAADKGHQNCIELLLCNGANLFIKDKYGKTARTIASDKGHKDSARLLKQAEKEPKACITS